MVKLVDMPDLGSGAARRVGSSPIIRTKSPNESLDFFCGQKGREVYAERSRSKSYYCLLYTSRCVSETGIGTTATFFSRTIFCDVLFVIIINRFLVTK